MEIKKCFFFNLTVLLLIIFLCLHVGCSRQKTESELYDYQENQSENFSESETSKPKTAAIKDAEVSNKDLTDIMIGEMIIVGFRASDVNSSSKIVKDINEYNIGGIILFDYDVPSKSFPRNIINPDQTKKLIEDIKAMTKSSLLVCLDAEGGLVNRLKPEYGFIQVDSPQKMGETSPEETYLKAAALAEELNYLGFNLNFAPVVDVNINPDNPVIGALGRSFSDDPLAVYSHSLRFIDAMNEFDIAASLKHFPGHGSSTQDSHLGVTDITDTYREEIELIPFAKLISAGKADIIMTAHIMNRKIDKVFPATLSSLFLKEILRDKLNFEGVIVSDDMQMGAITEQFGFEEAVIKAVNAGCNLLVFSNNGSLYDENIAQKAFDAVKEAVDRGEIKKETIVSSYEKIIELKNKFDI